MKSGGEQPDKGQGPGDPPDSDKSDNPSAYLLVMLGAMLSLSALPTDIYLSLMPVMSVALKAEAGSIQLTIAAFLLGFSLGQLVWGPISDRYGRRGPIMLGMILFVLGSIGCAVSQDVWMMIASRVLQATGACAGHVLARAIVRDLYSRTRSAQIFSVLMLIMGIVPLAVPIAGAQIMEAAGWRAVFWTVSAVGVVMLFATSRLPETLPPDRRTGEPLSRAFAGYIAILKDAQLVGYAFCGGLFFVGCFAFVAGLSFVYIDYYGMTPRQFAILYGVNMIGLMIAYFVNARVVMRFGIDRMLLVGTVVTTGAAIVLAINTFTGFGGILGVALPIFVYISMNGLVIPNSLAGALAEFPGRAGSAAAVIGVVHYGCGIFSSAMVGLLADGTPWTMGWLMAIGGTGSMVVAFVVTRRRR